MDTDQHGLEFGKETHEVIGCAFEVLNGLGHGLLEKPYENAMVVEFGLRGIPFQQQLRYPVVYKSALVGEYIPDLIAFDRIIVELKTIDQITNFEKNGDY